MEESLSLYIFFNQQFTSCSRLNDSGEIKQRLVMEVTPTLGMISLQCFARTAKKCHWWQRNKSVKKGENVLPTQRGVGKSLEGSTTKIYLFIRSSSSSSWSMSFGHCHCRCHCYGHAHQCHQLKIDIFHFKIISVCAC